MPYVEWQGDWCRRQSATIEEAELYLFPLPANGPNLTALCKLWVNDPSGGDVVATPWTPLGGKPFVLLAAARFGKIRSGSPLETLMGYIDELDVGFFVPVEVTVKTKSQGLFALNPFIYVDNPAGVIMGREIFGFPKIAGAIGWNPSILEFDLRSLVFKTNSSSTAATQEPLLTLKRSPLLSWLAPIFGSISGVPIPVVGSGVGDAVKALADAVLAALGVTAGASGFTSVRLPLLKQYRSAKPGNDTAYQSVVEGTFDIKKITSLKVYPKFLFWTSPLKLKLFDYPSVDIAGVLGLAKETKIDLAFKVECKLELEGKFLV